MSERRLITTAEVADKLCHVIDWFYKNRKNLETKHGFPKPVTGCKNRWDPEAIDRWLDSQMPEHLRQNQDNVDLEKEAEADRELERRGKMIAKGLLPSKKISSPRS